MMKKDPGRFTFRFNMADPNHQKAVECIIRQGHHNKAPYIVRAILYYEAVMAQLQQAAANGAEDSVPAVMPIVAADSTEKPKDVGALDGAGDQKVNMAIQKTMATFRNISA